jgi:hypothetical protein
MPTATHRPTGRTFEVPALPFDLDARRARGLRALDGATDGLVLCAGCGVAVSVSPGATAHAGPVRVSVATAQLDRVANDHGAWRADEPLGYGPATAVPTCEACNLRRNVDARTLANLDAAALARMERYATETTTEQTFEPVSDEDWLAAALAAVSG